MCNCWYLHLCYYITITTTVKWNPLQTATMLHLHQPIESSWKTLADCLLKDGLQYKIVTIHSNCFHDIASENTFHDALIKWHQCTVWANQTWQTLCVAAKKCKDRCIHNSKWPSRWDLFYVALLSMHVAIC